MLNWTACPTEANYSCKDLCRDLEAVRVGVTFNFTSPSTQQAAHVSSFPRLGSPACWLVSQAQPWHSLMAGEDHVPQVAKSLLQPRPLSCFSAWSDSTDSSYQPNMLLRAMTSLSAVLKYFWKFFIAFFFQRFFKIMTPEVVKSNSVLVSEKFYKEVRITFPSF